MTGDVLGIARPQTRSDQSVTIDGMTDAKWAAYTGQVVGASVRGAVGGVEAVAGRVGRQFAEARVTGARARQVLTPDVLEMIGRSLITYGESLHWLDVQRRARLRLFPCDPYWQTYGSADPDTQFIEACITGPTTNETRFDSRAAFLVVLSAPDPRCSWRGVPALRRADITAAAASAAEDALMREAIIPSKGIFPVPQRTPDKVVNAMRKDLEARMTTVVFPGTTQGSDTGGTPQTDWKAQRIQPLPEEALVKAAAETQARVVSALGVHPALLGGGSGAGGVFKEAVRQFHDLLMDPLGTKVARAASELLDEDVSVTWPADDDVMLVRARTLGALMAEPVSMPLDQARKIARLPVME